MTACIKDLYYYKMVRKCRVCKNISLKSNFYKNKTKKDGYRSECISCCKEYYYHNRDRLLNNMKNFNKQNRQKIIIYEKKGEKLISTSN